jgi:site-specific recombinase XerD
MTAEHSTFSTVLIAHPQTLPSLVAAASERTAWRFLDFFTATIRNPNTREAYLRAVSRFLAWCEGRGVHALSTIRPIMIASYIEQFPGAAPTIKQHLSAIRQCFD